jgi:hypothetical protein
MIDNDLLTEIVPLTPDELIEMRELAEKHGATVVYNAKESSEDDPRYTITLQ